MRYTVILRRTIVAFACAGAAITSASPVQATSMSAQLAASRDGTCDRDEFCYYYNSGHRGSISDFAGSLANDGATKPSCYEFKGTGNGKGACIKNNAASVWNRRSGPVTVYYHRDYAGPSQTIPAGGKVNLNPTLKNDNASHMFGSPSGSYGQPKANPHPAAVSRAPKATARTQFVDNEIARMTRERDCWVGGYRKYQSPRSNHNTGNALDCTISNAIGTRPTAAQRDQGWKLAKWLQKHADRLDVRYVISDGRIWSVARSSEGWRKYTAGSGVTGGHYDHVHVSIQNPYGD
jgi:hypothetical protein